MRFTNPAAWLGLVLLALPLAVHMLVRHSAPLQRLPTLRFLRGEPPVSIRRSRPDEPLLLLLRMAIVALAVAALAGPYLPSTESPDALSLGASAPPNRAVLLDESWSMLRPDPAGSALARARELAAEAAAEARASTVITFGADRPLEEALEGAAAWLETRPGPGEIVLVSDFQRGTLEAAGTVALPERLGLVPVAVAADPAGVTLPLGDGTLQATVEMVGGGGDVVEGGAVDAGAVRLTWSRPIGGGPIATTPEAASPGVELIFPGAPADSELRAAPPPAPASPTTPASTTLSPTASSLLLRLASDRTLAAAAAEDRSTAGAADRSPAGAADRGPPDLAPETPAGALIVARDQAGHALLTAGATPSSGLRVASSAPDGSLTAAALGVALARASDAAPPGEELELRFADAEQRASWARLPSAGDADGAEPTGSPAARWAWILVLGLLLAESLYRRRIHARRN